MQRARWTALGLGLLSIGPLLARPAGQAAQAAGTAAVSGVVSDAETGRPIGGASVSLLSRDPVTGRIQPQRPTTITDARGRFVFVDLPSSLQHNVRAAMTGYESGAYEGPNAPVDARSELGAFVTLDEGEWLRDANIRMRPIRYSAIAGRVTDERGEPVVGVAVQLFSFREVAGHDQWFPGGVVRTDDRGIYRVPVAGGRYFVAVPSVQATMPVSAADRARDLPLGGLVTLGRSAPLIGAGEVRGASIDVDGRHRLVLSNFATPPPPAGNRPRAYPPLLFPNARDAAGAQPIDIEPGEIRGDVDFRLEPVDAVTVSGRVTGPVDAAEHMLLRLMTPGTEHLGFGSEVATTIVEPGGAFTFLNVPSGRYTLVASAAIVETGSGGSEGKLPPSTGYGSWQGLSMIYPAGAPSRTWWQSKAGATVWGRMPVDVGGTRIADLELPLHATATVRGHLVFDDPEPPDPGRRINLMLEPANGDASLGVPNVWTDAGDDTWTITVEALQAGRYLPRIAFPRGWHVESISAGGTDLTDAGFDGSRGVDYDAVVITMTRAGASLAGRLTDTRGAPSSGTVLLFPVDRARWADYGLTPERLLSSDAAPDGTYQFTGVPGGEYYAIAVPGRQARDWTDTRFLAAAAARAARVSLSTGGTVSQDLRVSEVIVK